MNKGILSAALMVLSGVGVGALYVMNDPVGASDKFGFKLGNSGKEAAPAATSRPARATAAPAAAEESAPAEVAAAPATAPSRSTQVAQAATEAPSTEARRPPRRAETAGTTTETTTEQSRIQVARIARFVGPVESITGTPPSITDFPFNVVDRSYPNPSTLRVLLAVRNDSGGQWKTAYVTIKSPRHAEGFQYEIRDWMIGETVGLEYTFPAAELSNRVSNLQIVSVTGEVRESALANRLAQGRRQLVNTTQASSRNRSGAELSATGLIALIGNFQEPVTGIVVRPAAGGSSTRPLRINIGEELLLDRSLTTSVRETNEERQRAAALSRDFVAAAVAVEESIKDFASEVQSKGLTAADLESNSENLPKVRENLGNFNRLGVQLATLVRRSNDGEVKTLGPLFEAHAAQIRKQAESLESQVKSVDSFFRLQPGT